MNQKKQQDSTRGGAPSNHQNMRAPQKPDIPENSTEGEPAAERGERIASGKAIARGGKESGFVPGAEPERHD